MQLHPETYVRTDGEKEVVQQYMDIAKKRGFIGALIGGSTVAARRRFHSSRVTRRLKVRFFDSVALYWKQASCHGWTGCRR